MDITIVLLSIIVILLIVTIILIISRKKGNSEAILSDEFSKTRQELSSMLMQTRQELTNKINEGSNTQQLQLTNLTNINEAKLENNRKNMEERLESIRKTVEQNLSSIQKDNNEKLEKMRVTVDEKLQGTLEKRLGESFKIVNDRLESVYKGLGEMQTLAQGVGDLKKVFTNVKSRGYWGEVQLSNILEQFLTVDQYECNVKTRPSSNDLVEFAIKLPGKNDSNFVWLPVDSKFPIEDYSRLVEAEEKADIDLIAESKRKLENSVKSFAKDIHDKYLETPYTTDFGIMFLPTESLYCEVLKNTMLCESLSQKYRVVVSGPTTFVALLNSLQMGFKTLAIEKRSSEVWQLLGMVKSEFSKFGDILDKTNKKLLEISSTMELASKKSRTIERKLKKVEALPVSNEDNFYELDANNYTLLSNDENDVDNTDI